MTREPLSTGQWVVRVCIILIGLIAIAGGGLQMALGQPETTPRLDNVHRFMAGVYLGTGIIALWTGWTIREHRTLPLLIALGVWLAGAGRLLSITRVGLPDPPALWIGYLVPELVLPMLIFIAHWRGRRG